MGCVLTPSPRVSLPNVKPKKIAGFGPFAGRWHPHFGFHGR